VADRSVFLPMTWSNLERRYVRRHLFLADLHDCFWLAVTGRSMYLWSAKSLIPGTAHSVPQCLGPTYAQMAWPGVTKFHLN